MNALRIQAIVIVVSLIGFTGCNSVPNPVPKPQPPVESSGITYYETSTFTPDGRKIDDKEFPPRLDYKSKLRIAVDPSQLVPGVTDVLPPLTVKEQEQLKSLQDLVKGAREYIAAYAEVNAELQKQADQPATEKSTAAMKAAINRQAQAGLAVQLPLRAYQKSAIPDAAKRAQVNSAIFPPGVVLDLNALVKFIAEQSKVIVDQARKDAAALDANATTKLRIRATLFESGSGPKPIHVENYDRLDDLNVEQEPRIATTMSPTDRDRIQKELAFTKDVAQLINDIRNKKIKLNEEIDRVTAALRGDLKTWNDAAAKLDTLFAKLDPIAAALGGADGDANLVALQQSITDLKTKVESFRDIVKDVKDVRSANPSSDPVQAILNTADSISKVVADSKDKLASLVADIPKTVQQLEALRNQLANIHVNDVKITALTTAIAPDTLKAIGDGIAEFGEQYPALTAAIAKGVTSGRTTLAAADLIDIGVDPNLIDVDARLAGDGTVYLNRNVVGSGGTLRIDAALIDPPGLNAPAGTAPTSKQIASTDFAIEKFGLYSTWSTDLIFVDQFNGNGNQFAAAPSLSWNLHYNPPPREDRAPTSTERVWRELCPGAGLNVAALNFDNNGVEIGIGGHLSLFNDLLMAGAGYDLNANSDNGYFYLGISLFEAFNRAGLGSFGR